MKEYPRAADTGNSSSSKSSLGPPTQKPVLDVRDAPRVPLRDRAECAVTRAEGTARR